MTKKDIFGTVVLVLIAVALIFNSATKEKTTKLITNTYQKFSIEIPLDWSVLVSDPDEVQKRLDEAKNNPNQGPEQMYGYMDPEFTNETTVRGYSSAFQKGTTTGGYYGRYGTPYLQIHSFTDSQSIEEYGEYLRVSFEEKKHSISDTFKILKKEVRRGNAYWIIGFDRESDGDYDSYRAYIKSGEDMLELNAGHIMYSDLEKMILSIKMLLRGE